MIGMVARMAAGSGRSWGRWSMKPTSISHSRMSRPRYRKGTRPTELVASTTRRPPASRSSAIWQPDWALPTTSTAPSGSWAGPRYSAAWSWATRPGSRPARAGARGTFWSPVATTTVRARSSPSSLASTQPSAAGASRATRTPSRTGQPAAIRSSRSTTSPPGA
jgi:hypothetical protein